MKISYLLCGSRLDIEVARPVTSSDFWQSHGLERVWNFQTLLTRAFGVGYAPKPLKGLENHSYSDDMNAIEQNARDQRWPIVRAEKPIGHCPLVPTYLGGNQNCTISAPVFAPFLKYTIENQ